MYNVWTHLAPKGQKHGDELISNNETFIPMLLSSWCQMCPHIVDELVVPNSTKDE